jgi:multicomponent Na+:H+ antiporter subunit F
MTALVISSIVGVLMISGAYVASLVWRKSFFDRLLALNGIGTKAGILVVLVGLIYGRLEMFVDIALALFLLNFVTTLLVAKLVRDRGGLA